MRIRICEFMQHKIFRAVGFAAIWVLGLALFLQCIGMGGFTSWHTIRDLCIGFLVLLLGQFMTGKPLTHRVWHGAYLPFGLWMLVFPGILVLSAKGWAVNFGDVADYYKSALFTGVLTAFLFTLGRRYPKLKWPIGMVYTVVSMFFSLVAFAYVGYYSIFHIAFAAGDMLPVVQTSWTEAKGFLLLHGSVGLLLAIVIGLGVYVVGCGALAWHCMKGREENEAWKKWKAPFLLVLVIVLASQAWGNMKGGFPFYEYRAAKEFIESVKVAEEAHQKNLTNFRLSENGDGFLSENLPGTVLFVIGESENSMHMSAFNKAYPVETTPWLSKQNESTGFYVFSHAYSNYPQTTQSLGMVLMGQNQYNQKNLIDSVSIVDVAQKAGYDTWWISNHDKLANRNTPAVMVAGWSQHELWTSPSMTDDMKLLDFLKEVPKGQNHFIILHIMGSHSRYLERVPKDFPQVNVEGHDRNTNEYDTTVLYTDQVLQKIFEYARDNMNLQAMVYCSDHGEDMKLGHSAGVFSYDMIRIPFFVYVSPAYQQMYPETVKNLSSHRNAIFTNDLMYDTISGLLQAPNTAYESKWDLSNGHYDLPLDMAVSKHGEVRIAEDELLLQK